MHPRRAEQYTAASLWKRSSIDCCQSVQVRAVYKMSVCLCTKCQFARPSVCWVKNVNTTSAGGTAAATQLEDALCQAAHRVGGVAPIDV